MFSGNSSMAFDDNFVSKYLTNTNTYYDIWAEFSTGLLDTYSGAAAAYSMRRLSSTYTGACLKVERSSDGTTKDIGFDEAGNLDVLTLLEFVGTGDGRVHTWFDQSGNSQDTSQTVDGKQPLIVSSGSLIQQNEKPAMRFDGSNDRFPFDNSALDIGSLSSFTVGTFDDTTTDQVMLGLSGAVGNKRWYSPYLSGGNFNYGYATSCCAVTTTADTNQNLHTSIAGSTLGGFQAFLNGSSVGTDTLSSGIDTSNEGIMNLQNAFYTEGTFQEVIVYSSDQSSNRTGIETNINDYFNIY
jgi:hypothetical protein